MRKLLFVIVIVPLLMLGAETALATGYPWRDHEPPADFLFGNHIDTHQQSKVAGKAKLVGTFYIRLTGGFTPDGVPIAKHANCSEVPDECTVGWMLDGVAVQATLLAHEEGAHPTWCVNSAEVPRQPGYTHFHWLNESEHAHDLTIGHTYDGYLLKLTARDSFFFEHHGGYLVTPGIDDSTHANTLAECS